MPKLGLDEQKPDTRPATLGNAAMDADAQYSLGKRGRVDPARPEGKTQRLTWEVCHSAKVIFAIGVATRRDGAAEVSRGRSNSFVRRCANLTGNTRWGGPTMPRKNG